MTETIHAELSRASLTPRQHLIDPGYITAPILVSRKPQYGIEVIGPARSDVKWQANTDQGIDSSQFRIDWDQQQAICPQGHTSISWTPVIDNRNNEVIKIRFSTTDWKPCPCLASCTHSASRAPRRLLTVRPQAQHQALQAARRRPQTPAFAKQYALRQGIEATISQGVRAFGMRRSRSRGIEKTHLQHVIIATALNLVRTVAWLEGEPLAKTRTSKFAALALVA